MTAPVFILTSDTLEPAGAAARAAVGDVLALTGPEARHAVSVRRLRAGERVDLVDGAGLRLVCEAMRPGAPAAGDRPAGPDRSNHPGPGRPGRPDRPDRPKRSGGSDRLTVRVLERVEEPEPPVRLALVQAPAKGGRDEQAVETATEVGADLVIPWQASRCVSVWNGPKAAKGRARWQATAHEAAKQARRARVPAVEEAHSTPQLCTWVARAVEAGGAVLVLHEEGTRPISQVRLPCAPEGAGTPQEAGAEAGGPPVLGVVVGPEGGISEQEVSALEAAGATTVRLGPHVMRTASAGPVALAVLAQRAGLWG